MPQVNKSARPPVTRIGTFAHTVLFQTRKKQPEVLRSGVEAPTPTQRRIRTVNLPQDVLEIIIADLGDDTSSLKFFSETCYSWYLTAAPRLHRTLTLEDRRLDPSRAELKPLAKLHKMDLLPFVKKLCIRSPSFEPWFSPRKFDRRTLRHFSALTNVQWLRIEKFDLSKFMPNLKQYLGHFAPALRSISLSISSGTQRQLLYLLALFPNIDDIEIEYYPTTKPDVTMKPDPEVAVPFSVPTLRGHLKLTHFPSEAISRDMITLFGGLRFRYMDLYSVGGSRLLLEACADTLQAVRIYPTVLGKAREELLQDFNLSHLRSLRSLEVTASSISRTSHDALYLLRDIISTIESPVFSEIVLVFQRTDIYRPYYVPFDVFRQMHSKRKFRLVFCVEAPKKYRGFGLEMMMRRIEYEISGGGLDFLASPPTLVISEGNPWTG